MNHREFADLMMKHVAYMLRDALKQSGVSQVTAAEEVGISRGTLSRYINGKRDIPLRDFVALCLVVGTTPEAVAAGAYMAAQMQEMDDSVPPTALDEVISKEPTAWTADEISFIEENTAAVLAALRADLEQSRSTSTPEAMEDGEDWRLLDLAARRGKPALPDTSHVGEESQDLGDFED